MANTVEVKIHCSDMAQHEGGRLMGTGEILQLACGNCWIELPVDWTFELVREGSTSLRLMPR